MLLHAEDLELWVNSHKKININTKNLLVISLGHITQTLEKKKGIIGNCARCHPICTPPMEWGSKEHLA